MSCGSFPRIFILILTVFYNVEITVSSLEENHLRVPPGPYRVEYGQNITLDCNITYVDSNHYQLCSLYWKRDQHEVGYTVCTDAICQLLLTISDATFEDSGQYICHAICWKWMGQSEAVNVTVYGDQKYPIVNIDTDSYAVMYGRSLTIECSVQASDNSPSVLEIYWKYINNGVITKIDQYTDGISGSSIETPSLTILIMTSSESGIYTCFARNNLGTGQSKQVNVTVTGGVPIVSVEKTVYSAGYGEMVTLSCYITANPHVTQVYWEKVVNGIINVLNNRTVGIKGVSVEAQALTIVKATTADNGTYRCSSTNDVGTGKTEIIRLEVIGELPTVNVDPGLSPVRYGEKVMIACVVNAYPRPTKIYWEKESNSITNVINNGTIGTYGITVANPSLTIVYATDSDSGLYKCVAINEFGMGYSSSVKLSVTGGLPEVAVPSMTHLTGPGYTITLSCLVNTAFPAVSKVYWQRYIHGSTTLISSRSIGIKGVIVENPSLIIPSAMESMSGEYTCYAVNSVGTGSSLPVKLTVKAGVTPFINSKTAGDSKNQGSTAMTVIIAVVGTIAAVGSTIIAFCTYRRSKRSGSSNFP